MYIFKEAVQKNTITSQLMKPGETKHNSEVVENIIKRMETDLKTPEQKLVEQDASVEAAIDHMFFIAKGKCKVIIRDKFEDRYEEKLVNQLGPGDHFGEIALLYSCPRSSSVISENYITCSKISRQKYNELVTYYSDLSKYMRDYIVNYMDPFKTFLDIHLSSIEMFADLKSTVKNEIIFNMRVLNLDKGKYLFKKGDKSDRFYIV
mmetsp:Transcript_4558/g.6900  ORF Transcript_4558/g.6900 Transcript_4558/m.6900 type:complete len:206 (+) Transcript_4558:1529-2146(+)